MLGPRRRLRPWVELLDDRALLAALTLQVTGATLTEPFNKAFTAAQVATFTSSNTTAKAADFTATIDWGDGTTASTGTIKADTNVKGRFDVTGGHTYAGLTQETATVTITAPKVGASASAATVVNIQGAPFTEVPVSLHAVEGKPVNETVLGKFNSQVSGFVATQVLILWGDLSGVISGGKIVPDPTVKGRFEVIAVGVHNMFEETNYPGVSSRVNLQIWGKYSKANAKIATEFAFDSPIIVTDAPLKATGKPITFTTTVNTDSQQDLGTFLDADSNGTPKGYNIKVDWGDNTAPSSFNGKKNPQGQVFGTPDLFDLLAHHAYAKAGTFPVTITIKDIGGAPPLTLHATAEVSSQLTIYPMSTTEHIGLTTFAGPFGTDFMGSFPDGNAGLDYAHYSATIDWGDKTQTMPPDTSGLLYPSKDGKAILISGGHLYEEEGTYTITLTVTNKLTGKSTVASEQVTVKDAPLRGGVSISIVDGSGNFSGKIFTLQGDTKDDGTGWIVMINWGDTTSSAGTATHVDGGMQISGSHHFTFTNALVQSWQVTVKVIDDGGQEVTDIFTFTTGG
jgi:hypothetical protein